MTTELGRIYRDEITGFVGTADARAEYLYGVPLVRLVANTGPTGDEKERWYAEKRLSPHESGGVGFGKVAP